MRIIEYSRPDQLRRACKLIVKHKLYQYTHWMIYRWAIDQTAFKKVFICWRKGHPIGVCVVLDKKFKAKVDVAVYVKPEYRRRGVGRKLLQRAGFSAKMRHNITEKNKQFWESAQPTLT